MTEHSDSQIQRHLYFTFDKEATSHMCLYQDRLKELRFRSGAVRCSNDSTMRMEGEDTVVLNCLLKDGLSLVSVYAMLFLHLKLIDLSSAGVPLV